MQALDEFVEAQKVKFPNMPDGEITALKLGFAKGAQFQLKETMASMKVLQ